MKIKPYCIITDYIAIPYLNYCKDQAYVTLKEAQAAVKGQWNANIYKFKFDASGNAVSCKLCRK